MKEQFYIKYEPKITEDKYKQLIKKIEQLGYIFIGHCGWKSSYESFKKEGYLRSYSKEDNQSAPKNRWCIDNNKQSIIQEKFLNNFLEEKEQILTIEQTLSINDLVKYEYYHTKDRDSDFWMLFRFKQIESSNNQAFYTCCITKYKEFTKEDWLNISYRRITRKATAEEIQWLEICSKENKFIEFNEINNYMNKEEKWIPKKGEWVVSLIDKEPYRKIGDVFQVMRESDSVVYYLIDTNGSLSTFRKALPHEIPNNSSVNTFNFEENKYYSCIDTYLNSNTLWHFQFKSLNTTENKLHYFWSKNYENVIRTNDYLSYDRFKDFKLVTEQEAKGLLKQEESLIGRYATVIKNYSESGKTAKIGDIVKIVKACNVSNRYYCDEINRKYSNIKLNTTDYQESQFREIKIMPIGFIPSSVNQPIKEENMFKQGDYIVCLKKPGGNLEYLPPNYCYKQVQNHPSLFAIKDIHGSNTSCTDVRKDKPDTWRYATSEEIAEYNRIGKPFDVTTLNQKQELSLLEQAKLKYSEGIKFKTMLSNNTHISKGTICSANDFEISMNIEKNLGYSNAVVYKNGKWAEIVKQEDNSIPEYVECINTSWFGKDRSTLGNIYKFPEITLDNGQILKLNKEFEIWKNTFKPSTKEAYDSQFLLTDFTIKTHPVTPEECINNDVIEVGDEVELIKTPHAGYDLGDKAIIQEVSSSNDFKVYRKGTNEIVGGCNFKGHWKITKKKHSNTTVNKQLDISSAIQVGNEVTNITIPKSASVVLKNTENEVKIKINQKLTIKI